MIKTVSFAPPRAVRSASGPAKTAGKNAGARVASSPAPAKTSPAKPISTKTQSGAPKVESAPATLDGAQVRASLAPRKTRAAKVAPVAPVSAQVKPAKGSVSKAQVEAEVTAEPAATEKAAPKAKRSRVPKDLAAQYGGASESADVPRRVVETVAPRKRLTRAEKEARSQLLRAGDEVLQRLQQANTIAAKKPERRGRGWEFECGCCGRISRFQTPGALCQCGAIAVRE